MKITEVKYTKRHNEGNYEHAEYSATAIVDEDEKAADVFAKLKQEITAAHTGETQGEDDDGSNDNTGSTRGSKEDDAAPDDEDSDEETDSKDTDGDDGETESDDDSAEDADDAPAKGKAKDGKKNFKKKPQVYQRTNDAHKEIFSGLLKSVSPNWKKDEKTKTRAKDASVKMEGKDFLDEDGNVLDAFKQTVKKQMAGKK